jgi:hypothetical protein
MNLVKNLVKLRVSLIQTRTVKNLVNYLRRNSAKSLRTMRQKKRGKDCYLRNYSVKTMLMNLD